jgi:phosphatidylglycerol lysyltransferase
MAAGLRRYAVPALALAACVAVLAAAQRLSHSFDYHAVISTLRHLPPEVFARALLATLVSYLALIGRDAAGLRSLRLRVPAPLLWVGAAAGSALGNAAGFGALTGGAVRYRVFGAAGLTAPQVVRLTALTSTTFGLGLVALSGLGLVGAAPALAGMLGMSAWLLRGAGLLALAGTAAPIVWCRAGRAPLRLGRFSLSIPSRGALLAQLLLVAIDVACAGLALLALLPAAHIDPASFLAVYAVALLLGVIGHTPGGLGVFEAAIIFALGGTAPPASVVAALLAYRGIYFLLPLLLSGALLAMFEVGSLSARFVPRSLVAAAPRAASLVPTFMAVITFAIGVMLLVSGATPAFGTRLAILRMALPLWVVEGSQLVGSVLGVMLLFVARGLLRRLDAAWWLAMAIAALSLVLSLARGLAFVDAGVLAFLVLLLAATRPRFDRPTSLFEERFTAGWIVSVAIVLMVAFWVLFFAFRDVPYSRELWWQFEFDEKASRALRATAGASLFAAGFALWQLLRPAPGRFAAPTGEDLRAAACIVRAQERSDAMLAMMGDKSFLFSPSRRAFLMYAKRGRSWVALHDPIGPREEWPGLIVRFVALAHAHGGRAAFYQVRPEALPLYLEAGLTLMKLGEEACIALSGFSLEGKQRTRLRYALKRGERDGLTAAVHGPEEIPALLPTLRAVSDAWLGGRQAREKGFSVAAFDPYYLATQSVILVRQHGRAVAFATFMTTDLNTEATVGVMRHLADASPCTMEYLFTKLALHLKQVGFSRLSLGMAPLSGLTPTPLAGVWHRIGHLLWRSGGRLYNFRGLRSFKSKFDPEWQPRYLAASGLVGPFLALADLAVLAGRPPAGRRLPIAFLVVALLLGAVPARAATVAGGNYGEVHVSQPARAMRGFVVLFSRLSGWSEADQQAADLLAQHDMLVVGVDTARYAATLATRQEQCHSLVGDVEGISHQLQRELGSNRYFTPILAGTGEGGTLAEQALSSAPSNTVAGAVSIDPTATLDARFNPCPPDPTIMHDAGLPGFWAIGTTAAPAPPTASLVARLLGLGAKVTVRGFTDDTAESEMLLALSEPHLGARAPDEEDVSDLPLIELPAATPGPMLAIIVSGDGGWRDLDKTIARRLQAWGVSVVGVDSLRYFWSRRSPEQTAHDMARVMRTYMARWHAKRVALIGYSFGADVMPFVYNRLPPHLRDRVDQVSLLGFASAADFEVRVTGWLGLPPSAAALPVLPEIARLPPALVQCFYGEHEADTVCPQLAASGVSVIRTEGSHHFGGDYEQLAHTILDGWRRRIPAG